MMITSFRYFSVFLLLQATVLSHAAQPNTVVATINTGVTPDGMAITADGRFGYVANNNNYSIAGQDCVSVLNLVNNTVNQIIYDPSFNQPFRITINPAGTLAYVANSAGATLSIINLASNTVIGTIGGFDGPSGIVILPNGLFGYVNNYGGPVAGSGNGTTVSVVNLSTNLIVNTITVDQAPAALAISPDGSYVYCMNYVKGLPNDGTMSVIQTSNNTVVDTIPGFFGPFGIAITPNGNYAYVANFGSNNFTPFGSTVSVVDLNLDAIVATINLGIQPAGIAITPDGRYAYVTNFNSLYNAYGIPPTFVNSINILAPGQGTVNIIDIATNTVIPPTIAVDQSPNGVTISPNGRYAYVTNFQSNTVNVIALPYYCPTSCCPTYYCPSYSRD